MNCNSYGPLRFGLLACLASSLCLATFAAADFELQPGDHICLLGNSLAERMQHDGWLESLVQARFPKHQLVFRNLGFGGDELTIRLRSENFGGSALHEPSGTSLKDEVLKTTPLYNSPTPYLTQHHADVIFAFFGFNESFAGPAGVDKFKSDLDKFIRDTLQHQYNGKTPPRLILFSPIGHENLRDPNLPDGTADNPNLKLYTEAMAAVAQQHQVRFVDLYTPSLAAYAHATKPLTMDGIHLNERGNQWLASACCQALFPDHPRVELAPKALAKLRAAVVDKDFYWFNRYRTVDGYNVYGGRSQMRYAENISNWEVLQREMEMLDVMTANRDRRIWAIAQGGDLKVDDNNTPPAIPVKSNKPGPGPNGAYSFLDPEEAIGHMRPGKDMKVNLFASEKEFPALARPVQMAWDTQGRLWVACIPSYPHWNPKEELNDKILVFEDTNGDGKADKCTVFADHLNMPTGLAFYNNGLLVAQAPYLEYLKDTDGDGKADYLERLFSTIDSADTHHTANSFVLDPGGALYFQEGVFHHTQVETLWGVQRNINAGVYRYEPRTRKFEVYVAYNFANPHGHVFNRWGEDFVTDGTGAETYDAALFSGRVYFPNKHKRPPRLYNQHTRPCPATEILSSRQFPDELQGNLLVPNVIGFLGILQYKVGEKESGLVGTEVEPIIQSDDPNFRPADVKVGPEGAIYFLDWQNPIIGHLQHHLRDPSRDHTHGRIYRITYTQRPLLKPVPIAGQPIPKLLDLLKEPEDRTRALAKIELGGRNSEAVIAALNQWVTQLDPKDPEYEHHLLEALWMHQYHNRIDEALLKRMLRSPNYHARAAATRVLCYWRDRVSDPLALLKVQVNDEHPRVRLEAVRACSFFTTPVAAEIALEVLNHPMDEYLQFTLDETMNTLDGFLKQPKRLSLDQPRP